MQPQITQCYTMQFHIPSHTQMLLLPLCRWGSAAGAQIELLDFRSKGGEPAVQTLPLLEFLGAAAGAVTSLPAALGKPAGSIRRSASKL